MLMNATRGQLVRVHYRAAVAACMPLHGQVGRIVAGGRGRPRNHCVEIAGRLYIVPAGNLMVERERKAHARPAGTLADPAASY